MRLLRSSRRSTPGAKTWRAYLSTQAVGGAALLAGTLSLASSAHAQDATPEASDTSGGFSAEQQLRFIDILSGCVIYEKRKSLKLSSQTCREPGIYYDSRQHDNCRIFSRPAHGEHNSAQNTLTGGRNKKMP